MKRNHMISVEKSFFILDLLLCSIWGLFMFSTWGFSIRALAVPLLLVLTRLGVSFVVYKRIGYSLFSAIAFSVLLQLYEHRDLVVGLPIVRMVDYACMILGNVGPRLFYDSYYYTPDKEAGQQIANLGYAWLAGYPIIFAAYSLTKLKSVKLHITTGWKAVMKYAIGVTLYAYIYEFIRDPSSPPDWWVWTFLMSVVPFIVEYQRYKKNSDGFIPLWNDRQVRYYGLLSLIIFASFLIGRENPGYLGLVGVTVLPVLLLYILQLSVGKLLRKRDVLIMVVGSFVLWMAQFTDNELRIATLVINLCCVTYVFFLKGLNWKMLVFAPMAITLFIQPFCIGYNLYSATHVGMRSKYRCYDSAINGLWIVDCGANRIGLRDRYGIVLNADYEDIQHLQRSKPYVSVKKNGKWGIYDLEQHRMDIEPSYTDVIQKGKYTFLLYDKEDPQRSRYLTMYGRYHRCLAKSTKFYELSDTIPEKILEYQWP